LRNAEALVDNLNLPVDYNRPRERERDRERERERERDRMRERQKEGEKETEMKQRRSDEGKEMLPLQMKRMLAQDTHQRSRQTVPD
jgi:hypothetical protein